MKRLQQDILIYSVLLAISLLFWFVLIPQQIILRGSWSGDIVFTSRTFPSLLFVVIGIASVIGIIQTIIRIQHLDPEVKTSGFRVIAFQKLISPCGFFLLICLYVVLFEKTGYFFSTAFIIPIYMLALRCKIWQHYLIVYIFGIIVYAVFRFVLKIPL